VAPSYGQNRFAKRGLPFLDRQGELALETQASSFYHVVSPLVSKVNKSSVQVELGDEMVSLGTVTESGVLTKWSEIQGDRRNLTVLGFDGVRRGVRVKAIYKDYDLALLDYGGELPGVDFSKISEPGLGSFLVLAGPGEGARGLGVVSVEPRSLREEDKAFLGVRMGSESVKGGGVRLQSIEEGSAAERAGLKANDVVIKINEKNVNGLLEMGNMLQRMKPGSGVHLFVKRGNHEFEVKAMLGARPKFKRMSPRRMNRMKSMGGSVSKVGEGFPDVIQSDMQIDARESGGPVFDLDGNFVGVVVARSSRIKTYIIPAAKLAEVLAGEPDMVATPAKKKAR